MAEGSRPVFQIFPPKDGGGFDFTSKEKRGALWLKSGEGKIGFSGRMDGRAIYVSCNLYNIDGVVEAAKAMLEWAEANRRNKDDQDW